ncbi:MAG: hypothetical protein IPM74_16285 [Crocinitomicaceae bacterium]|nr:hypothetical protein [Crocinitomicaceae bacterium]MBK8927408.1 hypothetical protein [Crocinitomicaceae bacterium]
MTDSTRNKDAYQSFFSAQPEEEIAAPVAVWNNLSGKLDTMRKERKRKRIIFWMIFSSAACLILSIGGLIILNDDQMADENTNTNSTYQKSLDPGDEEPHALNGNLIPAGTKTQSEEQRESEGECESENQRESDMNANENSGDQKTTNETEIEKTTNPLTQSGGGNLTEYSNENGYQQIVLHEHHSFTETKNQQEELPEKLKGASILPIANYEIERGAIPIHLTKPVDVFNYAISFYIGPGRRENIVSLNVNDDHIWSNKFSETKPRSRTFNTGLLFQYKFNPYLSIGTGLGYSSWKFKSKEFMKMIVHSNTGYEFDSPTGRMAASTSDLESFYDNSITGSDTLLFKIAFAKTVKYVNIPLYVKLSPGLRIINPYVRLGASVNILAATQNELRFVRGGNERNVSNNQRNGLQPVYLSAQPALGIEFHLGKRISLFVEGQSDFPLQKFYKPENGFIEWDSREMSVLFGTSINF